MSVPFDFALPTPLQYFAALVAEDQTLALLEAAASLAQDENAELDTQSVLAEVDQLAAKLARRIPADAAPLQRLRLLNHYFFGELGFAGNVNDFYDRHNSYLSDVLARRRGIPITLALIYMELASHVGLSAAGVAFPGHFLVKLHMPQGEVIIDPFSGESLSRSALDERLQPFREAHGLAGEDDLPLGLFLQTAPPRDIVARLLRNLKEIHASSGDDERLLAVLNRLVILLPEEWEELRDRGLAQARLGRTAIAAVDLTVYLTHCPDAQDASAMRRQVEAWRAAGTDQLH